MLNYSSRVDKREPTFLTHSLGEGAFFLEIDDPLLHNTGPAQREWEEMESLRSEVCWKTQPECKRMQNRAKL